MNKLRRNLATLVGATTSVVAAAVLYSFGEKSYAEQKEISALTGECMQIAAGEDGILDTKEAAVLARDLGYRGAILPDEKIILQDSMSMGPRLVIGYNQSAGFGGSEFRELMKVSPEKLRDYRKSHKK